MVEIKKKKKKPLDVDPAEFSQRIKEFDKQRKEFKGQQGKGPGSLQEGFPADPGQPAFISKEDTPERFRLLKERAGPESIKGQVKGAGGLNAATIAKIIAAQNPKDADKVVEKVEKSFLQKVKDFGVNKEAQATALEKERSGQGTSFIEDVKGGMPSTIGEAVSDAVLVATGGIGGTPALQGIGGAFKGATGIGLGAKAGARVGTEVGKLSPVRRRAVVDLLKGNKGQGLSTAERAVNRELTARKVSQMLKIKPDAAIRAVNSFNKWDKTKIIKFLQKPPVKTSLKVGGAVAGADVIWTWFALDNISTGLKFTVSQVEEGLQKGTLTPQEAEDLFAEADLAFDAANTKVQGSTILNPLLWPAFKLIRQGVKVNKLEYDLRKANLIGSV